MKLTKKSVLPVVLGYLAIVGVAQAQAQVYTEASYWSLSSRATGSSGTTESNGQALTGIVGYEIDSNYSVEGMLGTGLGGADVKLNGASQAHPVTSKLDQAVGIYLRAKFDVANGLSAFARLGWAEWRGTSTNNVGSTVSNLSDLGYGAGLNYQINPSTYISGSWMSLYNKGAVKVDGWSVGLGYGY